MDIIYDVETYKNVFTLAAECADAPFTWSFEISEYRDDSKALLEWLLWLKQSGARMVGFNNVGFDYPVLHTLVQTGKSTPRSLYEKAMAIIHSQDDNRFAHMVYPSDRFVEQLDLFKIHHFDNRARATSLKVIEFNMRMDNVSDLPFPVGTYLTPDQIVVLKKYNAHDVKATKAFYHVTTDAIKFREELTAKYGKDFMNHSDVKIGSEIFQIELEKAGVQCYDYGSNGRTPRQTQRPVIRLADCLPKYTFINPEFTRVREWLAQQVITETKGVFTDLTAKVGGLEFVFGTGGAHASVENEFFRADEEWMIYDMDVSGMYPAIAIANGYYPQHLGKQFVTVYKSIGEERAKFKKGTMQNAAYKLAGNGAYGKSNDKFSIFFDPQFTMSVTLTGQMAISLLVDMLLRGIDVDAMRLIQVNTDGVTVMLKRSHQTRVTEWCRTWEKRTGLMLEYAEYSMMAIRDVNNYIAVKTDGSVKRKGAYEYDMDWHQNHSALVVPKVVEKVLAEGAPIRQTLENWPDKMDFMLRVKVPRGSKLVGVYEGKDYPMENTQRYYVAKGGVQLIKIMPPLAKKPTEWRRIGVESGWTVCPCNDIKTATLDVNFDYYVAEIEKLCLGVM